MARRYLVEGDRKSYGSTDSFAEARRRYEECIEGGAMHVIVYDRVLERVVLQYRAAENPLWLPWVLGGVAVLGAGAVGYAVWKQSQPATTPFVPSGMPPQPSPTPVDTVAARAQAAAAAAQEAARAAANSQPAVPTGPSNAGAPTGAQFHYPTPTTPTGAQTSQAQGPTPGNVQYSYGPSGSPAQFGQTATPTTPPAAQGPSPGNVQYNYGPQTPPPNPSGSAYTPPASDAAYNACIQAGGGNFCGPPPSAARSAVRPTPAPAPVTITRHP